MQRLERVFIFSYILGIACLSLFLWHIVICKALWSVNEQFIVNARVCGYCTENQPCVIFWPTKDTPISSSPDATAMADYLYVRPLGQFVVFPSIFAFGNGGKYPMDI